MKKINVNQHTPNQNNSEPSEKTVNLWNLVKSDAMNTVDFLAKNLDIYDNKLNYVNRLNSLFVFKQKFNGNTVIEKDDELITILKSLNGMTLKQIETDYNISDILVIPFVLEILSKPNGFGMFYDKNDITMIMTNGSTFKLSKFRPISFSNYFYDFNITIFDDRYFNLFAEFKNCIDNNDSSQADIDKITDKINAILTEIEPDKKPLSE